MDFAVSTHQEKHMKRATLGKIAALVISASALNGTHLAAQTTCSNDMFGNTTYRDNRGNTTICSTDMFGNTTCR